MHNCLSIPFDSLLENGFTTRQADVRPASSVGVAFQLLAVIFQCQSLEQFGGVSATHLDWTMEPYVRMSFHKHFEDGLKYILKDMNDYNSFEKWTRQERQRTLMNSKVYKKPEFKEVWDYAYDMTKRELDQAVEGMYHNLNTLQSRSGNQLPFTSINYGTCTSFAGRMVIKSLLEGCIAGVGKFHKTAIFPCGIFTMKKGINRKPGDPNYDMYKLAQESTAKRIYPNYCLDDWSINLNGNKFDREQKQNALNLLDTNTYNAFYDWLNDNAFYANALSLIPNNGTIEVKPYTEVNQYELSATMGCRTYNGYDINADADYFKDLFEYIVKNQKFRPGALYSANQKDGRGNICPNTIILPTLAMEAKLANKISHGDLIEEFMHLLEKKMIEAKDQLIERFNWIASQNPKSAPFMWGNNTMSGYIPEEGPISALKHGTLALGQIGLSECLRILIGEDQTTRKGMKLAKRIETLFNENCAKWKKQYKLNIGVYYTPAENLCKTSMINFKKKFGEVNGITNYIDENGNRQEREYFTNSIHVPVWDEMDPFTKIDIESQLTGFSNAGCITYVELPSTTQYNLEAEEEIINYAMKNDIPYFAINTPIDYCEDCGYQHDMNDVCPVCGSHHITHLRRITGYLTGDYKTAANAGKQQEIRQRVLHIRSFK